MSAMNLLRRRSRLPRGASAPWLGLVAIVVFLWGVERWRSHAASRATQTETQRFHGLVRCLLGPDGPSFVYDTARARTRLRALAMATQLTPAPTWIDRCVPLARDLAVHGQEIDVTRAPQRAETHVSRRAHDLALGIARVGLVWQVRSGDPDADLAHIAELIARTATELDLANGPTPVDRDGLPVAPVPPTVATTEVTLPGALPLPIGNAQKFFVGAPLPAVARVTLGNNLPVTSVVFPLGAIAWRILPDGVVRLDPRDGHRDGLSPVHWASLDSATITSRITAPPFGLDPEDISISATSHNGVLWLGETTPGSATVLARLPSAQHSTATAVRLAEPATILSDSAPREDISVAFSENSLFAAYSLHHSTNTEISVVRATDNTRAAVRPLRFSGPRWTFPDTVSLTFCKSDNSLWLIASSANSWRVATVEPTTVTTRFEAIAPANARYDGEITARCDSNGVLLYGSSRPRVSPIVWCSHAQPCRAVPTVPSPDPRAFPSWVTRDATGRAHTHPEWPLSIVSLSHGELIAARTAGALVALTRLAPGASQWSTEYVVFDAAATEPGAVVHGAEVYSLGQDFLVAVGTRNGLKLIQSQNTTVRRFSPR